MADEIIVLQKLRIWIYKYNSLTIYKSPYIAISIYL